MASTLAGGERSWDAASVVIMTRLIVFWLQTELDDLCEQLRDSENQIVELGQCGESRLGQWRP